jgi:hypothetical protein
MPSAELRQQRRAELGQVDHTVRNRAAEEPRVVHGAHLVEQLRLRPLRTLALAPRQLVNDVGHAVALGD